MTKSNTHKILRNFGLDPKTKPFSRTPDGIMRLYVGEDTQNESMKLVVIAKTVEPSCIILGSHLAAKLAAELLSGANAITARHIKATNKSEKKAKKSA